MLFQPFSLGLSPHARGPHSQPFAAPVSGPDATPNIVTPLLAAGKVQQAQDNSRVNLPGWNETELYSGFFTIDASTDSHTYFMFSTARSGRKDAPVLLWLNGGPGASSLLGFYDEVRPYSAIRTQHLRPSSCLHALRWARAPHSSARSTSTSRCRLCLAPSAGIWMRIFLLWTTRSAWATHTPPRWSAWPRTRPRSALTCTQPSPSSSICSLRRKLRPSPRLCRPTHSHPCACPSVSGGSAGTLPGRSGTSSKLL